MTRLERDEAHELAMAERKTLDGARAELRWALSCLWKSILDANPWFVRLARWLIRKAGGE